MARHHKHLPLEFPPFKKFMKLNVTQAQKIKNKQADYSSQNSQLKNNAKSIPATATLWYANNNSELKAYD
jgi:hypothetical protein